MEEIVFKPQYRLGLLLMLGPLLLLEGLTLLQLYSSRIRTIEMVVVATLMGGVILLLLIRLPQVLIRRIRFKSDSFVIERYLLPAKTVNYVDVTDFGLLVVKTRQGSVPMGLMKNAEDLEAVFGQLTRTGRISPYQIEAQLAKKQTLSIRATSIAGLIALVPYSIALILDILPEMSQPFRELSFLLFFLPVYVVVLWYLKRRAT